VEEVPQALEQSEAGLERIAGIVQRMAPVPATVEGRSAPPAGQQAP
jgi:hypothetical protein